MNHTPVLLHDHDEFLNEKIFLNGIDVFVDIVSCLADVESNNYTMMICLSCYLSTMSKSNMSMSTMSMSTMSMSTFTISPIPSLCHHISLTSDLLGNMAD